MDALPSRCGRPVMGLHTAADDERPATRCQRWAPKARARQTSTHSRASISQSPDGAERTSLAGATELAAPAIPAASPRPRSDKA